MSLRRRTGFRVVLVAVGLALCAFAAQVGLGAFGADAEPAVPVVSSAPLRPTTSTRATLAFDQRPGLGYECAVDGNAYAACPSPVTVGALSRSAHTFRVRARTPAGATSPAGTYSWTIVAPRRRVAGHVATRMRPTFTTGPVRPWTSRNATFAWRLERSTTAECRLDDGRWRRCGSPRTYLGLELGLHVFEIRARDTAGRRSNVNRFSWTITASPPPPAPTISSQPDATTTSTDAAFGFSVEDGQAAECRLDAGAWVACSSVAMYVGLGVGSHVFCVRAVSGAGAVSAETCVAWTIVAAPSVPEPTGSFTITGNLSSSLTPGSSQALALTVSNPFDFKVRVTSLTVTVLPGSTQAGCDGPSNLVVTQSNTASGTVSIVVPARGAVTLPAQGATTPTVTMLDLATSQDACKGALFSVRYAGTGVQS